MKKIFFIFEIGLAVFFVAAFTGIKKAEGDQGACNCSGTVTAGALTPNSTFDGYCPQVKQWCSSCGGGTASCNISVPASQSSECDAYNSDPSKLATTIGIPSYALSFINVTGECTFSQAALPVVGGGDGGSGGGDGGGGESSGDGGACAQGADCPPPNVCNNGKCAQGVTAGSTDTSAGTTGGGAVNCPKGQICLENPIGPGQTGITDVNTLLGTVIKAALGIIGSLTLLMLIWGGFQWLTSAGNPEKVKSGTQTMVWAIIGVVLVFSSYIILNTFTNYLTGGGK